MLVSAVALKATQQTYIWLRNHQIYQEPRLLKDILLVSVDVDIFHAAVIGSASNGRQCKWQHPSRYIVSVIQRQSGTCLMDKTQRD